MSSNTFGFRVWGRAAKEISARSRFRRDRRNRLRPTLQALEERQLLSTFTVSNTNDSGTGSLRYEIGLANAEGTNTIDFNTNPAWYEFQHAPDHLAHIGQSRHSEQQSDDQWPGGGVDVERQHQ